MTFQPGDRVQITLPGSIRHVHQATVTVDVDGEAPTYFPRVVTCSTDRVRPLDEKAGR